MKNNVSTILADETLIEPQKIVEVVMGNLASLLIAENSVKVLLHLI